MTEQSGFHVRTDLCSCVCIYCTCEHTTNCTFAGKEVDDLITELLNPVSSLHLCKSSTWDGKRCPVSFQ